MVVSEGLREGLIETLAVAPPGTQCAVDGFTEWSFSRFGWRHRGTGAVVSSAVLADLIAASIEDGSTQLTLVEEDDDDDTADEEGADE